MTADIDQGYGGLVEGVHLAGYSLERAIQKLKWLLQDNRWKSVGNGFDDFDAFLDSIKFDNLKIIAAERKELAALIKQAQPQTSNRRIAETLRVDHKTVAADIGETSQPKTKKPNDNSVEKPSGGENSPLSGAAAAKAVESKETKDERKAAKQEARNRREAELGAKQRALPAKKYGVIGADPEWKFETWSEAGMDRSADNHYPTSELTDIKARDVASIAADDCVLFLWATVPMLPQALEVMKAWGFGYVTNFAWLKDTAGTGYWNRNRHELLLIGTKGNVPAPAPGTQWDSAIPGPVGEHSEKPDWWLELIEDYFPNLPKIELNRRGPAREGWDAWGNEAEVAA